MNTFYGLRRCRANGYAQVDSSQYGWLLCVWFMLLLVSNATQAQNFPAGFSQQVVASGLSQPTVVAFAPDGRIFVAEQGGSLRIIKNGSLLVTPFIQLSVNADGERGLIGLALDPNFSANQFVYVYYTVSSPVHNRVSRFRANGDVVMPGSEQVLLDLEPLNATNHNGGSITFGKDGKLYVGVGENAVVSNSQTLENHLGKILRINADGTIPTDNPFPTGSAPRRRIWAYGLRNPYTVAIQPGTGRIFVNDVGQSAFEEINDATVAGRNFGWPGAEGASTNPAFVNPTFAYSHTGGDGGDGIGCAITGGTFFNPSTTNYPASFVGKYFYQDFCNQWINVIDVSGTTVTRSPFATGLPGLPVGLATGPDGNLYYLSLSTGSLYRISYTSANTAPTVANQIPNQSATVGQTFSFTIPNGTFTDAQTPNNLSLSANGLPAGLVFTAPATISGTPSASGVSTVTVTATDPGQLAVNATFTITVSPATSPPTNFAITGVNQVSCDVVSAGQRRLSFTPQYSGLTSQPVSFSVNNELAPTTTPGPYTLTLYTDNPTITLKAQQGAAASSFAYNWLAACSGAPTGNTPPTVVNPIANQSATLSQAFNYVIPTNTFTDAQTPNNLTLLVNGLPAGLNFTAPATISGTPTALGISEVTVTATDPGQLSKSTVFIITVNAAPTQPTGFAITGANQVSCQVITASQRRLSFSPQYTGLNGQPVSFSVSNELAPTTSAGPYTLTLYTDNPTITLKAQQGGATTSFAYNWLAACSSGNARSGAEPVAKLSVSVLGNPILGEIAEIDVTGAQGELLHIQTLNSQGQSVSEGTVAEAASTERVTVRLGRSAGVYFLRVATPTQKRLIKLLKY